MKGLPISQKQPGIELVFSSFIFYTGHDVIHQTLLQLIITNC